MRSTVRAFALCFTLFNIACVPGSFSEENGSLILGSNTSNECLRYYYGTILPIRKDTENSRYWFAFDENAIARFIYFSQSNCDELVSFANAAYRDNQTVYATINGCQNTVVELSSVPSPGRTYIFK